MTETQSKPTPGLPVNSISQTTSDVLNYLQTRTFVFFYRNKFNVQSAFVLAANMREANTKCEQYCGRFGLRFISVKPFYLDLDKLPIEDNDAT